MKAMVLNTVGYFSAKELEPRVENEVKLFQEIKPAAVLTGWCLRMGMHPEQEANLEACVRKGFAIRLNN